MSLTADEMETMDVGQIVVDVDGHEWRQDSMSRWDGGERGRMWAGALIRHYGPIRQKGWPPFSDDDAERARHKGRVFTLPSIYEEQPSLLHVEQSMPTPSTGPSMHVLAVREITDRMDIGLARYGQPLQAMNGRDAVRDTIEELADGLAYALQIREERRLLREELEALALSDDQWALRDIINRYFPEETS